MRSIREHLAMLFKLHAPHHRSPEGEVRSWDRSPGCSTDACGGRRRRQRAQSSLRLESARSRIGGARKIRELLVRKLAGDVCLLLREAFESTRRPPVIEASSVMICQWTSFWIDRRRLSSRDQRNEKRIIAAVVLQPINGKLIMLDGSNVRDTYDEGSSSPSTDSGLDDEISL